MGISVRRAPWAIPLISVALGAAVANSYAQTPANGITVNMRNAVIKMGEPNPVMLTFPASAGIESRLASSTCAPQFIVGINPDFTLRCADIPAQIITVDPVDPGPVPIKYSVSGCSDAKCSGAGPTIVFPVRNTTIDMQNNKPVRCDGAWWIDVSGSLYDSGCTGGWVQMANCDDGNGGSLPGCTACDGWDWAACSIDGKTKR